MVLLRFASLLCLTALAASAPLALPEQEEKAVSSSVESRRALGGSAAAPHGWKPSSACGYDTVAPAYVSAETGTDSEGAGTSRSSPYKTIAYAVKRRLPCQTIYVAAGTYRNVGTGPVVNLNGVSDLVITGDGARPLIEFTGAGGFVGGSSKQPVQNVEISGFEIAGPSAEINYTQAMAARLVGGTYYTGRGVSIWEGDHIYIHDLVVHHCPSSGIRVNNADYVTISDSVVHSNCWWSSAAESAVVLATSKHIDEKTDIKMRLVGNIVHDNMNKVPYYNKNYKWDYSPIRDDCGSFSACERGLVDGCPWQCRYGKATQDYIIDGQGVYVTRNKDTYAYGKMQMADNTCYGNGINGLVVHRTDRVEVKSNVVYGNGVVPRSGKPEPFPEDWQAALGKGRQPYSGLVLNNAEEVTLWSNAVAARYDDDFALTQVADGSGPPAPVKAGGNNTVCKGKMKVNPSSIARSVADVSACGGEARLKREPSATAEGNSALRFSFV